MAIKFLNTVQVDTDVLYVDTADDRVGIGTDNPDVRLHVDGGSGILVNNGGVETVLSANSNSGIFSIGDTGGLGDGVYATNTGTSYFDIYSDGSVKFRMDSSGKVGIGTGTSALTQKLHVNGNARLTGLFYDGTNSGGTAGQILSSDGGQTEWIDQGDVVVGEADKAKSVTLRVKNSTASPMTKGQVICEAVSATPPNGNLIEVALADNNGVNKMPALGILNEDLDASGGNNDEGDAIMFGKVSGIDTSAFEVGDEVFVSDVPGGLTTTKPTGVKYIQKVGVVIRDDNNNGTIEVFGAGRVNDVPTPLYVDHANQRLGVGVDAPKHALDVGGATNSTVYLIEEDLWAIKYGGFLQLGDFDGKGFPTTINDEKKRNTITVKDYSVGVGINSPAEKMHVFENETGDTRILVENKKNSSSAGIKLFSGGSGYDVYVNDQEDFIIYNGPYGKDNFLIDKSGKVGIGPEDWNNNTPSQALEVVGSVEAQSYINQRVVWNAGFYHTSSSTTSYFYVPSGYVIESTGNNYFNNWIAPYAGRVRKIVMRNIGSGNTPTATTINFRITVNGTVTYTGGNATITGSGLNQIATYEFNTSPTLGSPLFSATDRVQIAFRTNGPWQNAAAGISLEYTE